MTRPAIFALLACACLAAPSSAQTVAMPSSTTSLAPGAPRENPDPLASASPGDMSDGLLSLPRSGDEVRRPMPGFSQIFRDLGGDFARLPSRENALLLGIGAGLAAMSAPSDRSSSNGFQRVDDMAGFLGPGATIGNFYVQLAGSFATYAVGRATGSTRTAAVGADLVRAQILAQATTQGIKYIAGRERPNGESRSFPSGHTSSAFATATVLQRHFGWKVGIPAYALAGYVGASRIHDSKHYLSDVAFGAALGIVAGRTVTVGTGSTKFALAPIAAHGGVGIGFTRISKK